MQARKELAPQTSITMTSSSTNSYTFVNQEHQYNQYRPKWPVAFALASLKKVGISYKKSTGKWLGLNHNPEPVIVSIGSGTGADAETFLALGCKVYAIEPNAEFRNLALQRLGKYGDKFVCISGNAHELNLPADVIVDLIVCAQALHTFSFKVTGIVNSEAVAGLAWHRVLPQDNKSRISIWYYNLAPTLQAIIGLDKLLKETSPSYKQSKTSFIDAPLFEPKEFLHYIEEDEMTISRKLPVDCVRLDKSQLLDWLMSYSFCPKSQEEKNLIVEELYLWFKNNKNADGLVELPYIGYIAQGALRNSLYLQEELTVSSLPPSPISRAGHQEDNAIVNSLLKNHSLFKAYENNFLIANRHTDPRLQRLYDEQYGLVLL